MAHPDRFYVPAAGGRTPPSRDITAFVDAACVAGAISGVAPRSLERFERRRPSANRGDGAFADGVWYEPAERRKDVMMKQATELQNLR